MTTQEIQDASSKVAAAVSATASALVPLAEKVVANELPAAVLNVAVNHHQVLKNLDVALHYITSIGTAVLSVPLIAEVPYAGFALELDKLLNFGENFLDQFNKPSTPTK